jgi:hypothetical protein
MVYSSALWHQRRLIEQIEKLDSQQAKRDEQVEKIVNAFLAKIDK